MHSTVRTTLVAALILWLAGPLAGQVVRETDVASIAGTLGGYELGEFDEFGFSSQGDEILFVDLDAAVYQSRGAHGEDHTAHTTSAPEGDDHDCGSGVGPALCLQVLDGSDAVICWAARPALPGWQRDPRLACVLPSTSGRPEAYRLRVTKADDDCSDLLYGSPPREAVPYLLNVSLRRIAPEGEIAPAIAQSRNRF